MDFSFQNESGGTRHNPSEVLCNGKAIDRLGSALDLHDNPGNLGEGFTNRRLSTKSLGSAKNRKRWFSRKYYASVHNIQEFFADNLGKDCCLTIAQALNPDTMRKRVTL